MATHPPVHLRYQLPYLVSTGAVPNYDPNIKVSQASLTEMSDRWPAVGGLMQSGFIYKKMPEAGARPDIGPLPRWTVRHLLSQDPRAQRVSVGTSEQAGSWPIHYRDASTDLPLSTQTYPGANILGSDPFFPACAGNCSTPFEPDVAHQPSLSFVPFLLTGDYFHLEELQYWANYNSFYWGDHGGGLGLVINDQLRAQAWGLRTIAQAAWATPDSHPLKRYFEDKLANNLEAYRKRYVDAEPNQFGHATPTEGHDGALSFWMDDFFTWALGYIAGLGFQRAEAIHDFKSRFVVGRFTEADYCWIMASAYWARMTDADTGQSLYATWGEMYRALVADDPESIRPEWLADAIRTDSAGFLAADCGSETMGEIMGFPARTMVGYPSNPEAYTMNISPALASAVDRDLPGAEAAWRVYQGRSNDYSPSLHDEPHWAIVPIAAGD
ncbi:MAG: hypothetical protein V3V08_16800 [Nannocystaceae bacterium]